MTDKEIIKALECCTIKGAKCMACPAFKKVDRSDCKKYFRGAIDLIKCQQAEIERLQDYNKNLQTANADISNKLFDEVEKGKTEAIKEFAERLKESEIDIDVSFGYGRECYTKAVTTIEIDNLVKEIVGENNENSI